MTHSTPPCRSLSRKDRWLSTCSRPPRSWSYRLGSTLPWMRCSWQCCASGHTEEVRSCLLPRQTAGQTMDFPCARRRAQQAEMNEDHWPWQGRGCRLRALVVIRFFVPARRGKCRQLCHFKGFRRLKAMPRNPSSEQMQQTEIQSKFARSLRRTASVKAHNLAVMSTSFFALASYQCQGLGRSDLTHQGPGQQAPLQKPSEGGGQHA